MSYLTCIRVIVSHYRESGNLVGNHRKPACYSTLLCFGGDTRLREYDECIREYNECIREYDEGIREYDYCDEYYKRVERSVLC